MSIYRVEKTEQPVTLFHADGAVESGVVFLSPCAYTHIGQQTLMDLLREKGAFFPFRGDSGTFQVINKETVSHIRYQPSERERGAETLGTPVEVRITFAGGELLHGTVIIEMPEGRTRLLDFINESRGFFILRSDEAHYLVNVDQIRSVNPA
ncbi:MAG: hypothetical protein RQ723_06015 [Desulfuromonadales bacterium]|nr:hypothetical protein [Desulfuromonadales bacterium]